MDTLKSLLVHVDTGPHAEARLRFAGQLAREHGAALTAWYAVASVAAQTSFEAEAVAGATGIGLLQELDANRRRVATALVERVAAEAGAAIAWQESHTAEPVGSTVRRALLADLAILGQRDPARPAEGVPFDFVESVVIGSGSPALVLPYVGIKRSFGERILVAWKATRPSARALRGALPFLARAREVHLVSWGEDDADVPMAFLRQHGVEARLDASRRPPAEVGESLLSLAADVSADMLVMGCYGHSRMRELLMGGASRTILESMTVPVLMAH